jgi:hypothetical protein
VRVHDPAEAVPPPAAGSPPQSPDMPAAAHSLMKMSPWLDWICRSLAGRSLDVVHFVCRADVTDGRGALLLSSSPAANGQLNTLSFLSVAEITALLTRTGAWAAAFSPPPDGGTAAMVAFVADALAHFRPGPVLYHPLPLPREREDLRLAYRFLSAAGTAPRLHHGFLYHQPRLAAGPVRIEGSPVLAAVAQNADLFAQTASLGDRVLASVSRFVPILPLHELKQPPNWVSAAQRYVETVALEQLRRGAADVLFSKASSTALGHASSVADKASSALEQTSGAAASDVVQRTLSDIQKSVGDYLKMTR